VADNDPRYTFTIACSCEGYNLSVPIEASPAKLPALLKRLRELGIEPVPPASTGAKVKAAKVQPFYDGDGTACCPVHKRELKEGKFGLYCSAKDKATDQYCNLKFVEA
jgi:hypothetical protein